MTIPKINSINIGGKWIGIALLIGGVIPFVIWLVSRKFLWEFCVAGAILLITFLIVFIIEMQQDSGRIPYYKKHLKDEIPFNPEKQYPVIKSSICTGEKVAGFKNKTDGKFIEVMVIKNESDKKLFMETYGLEKVDTEY